MKIVDLSIRQPITVVVGVLFTLLAGFIALQVVAVEMAPEVEDTVIAVSTRWENASPQEIESEIVDPQEEKLQGLSNLKSITSISSMGSGEIRLEFNTGVDKNVALREVSDKLREVPSYPFGVDEPIVEATDPESQDYIAWYILTSEDQSYDVRLLQDFALDNIKPVLERIEGMSEVNALGGTEREVQIAVDDRQLARHGFTMAHLAQALRSNNTNASAGAMAMGKYDIRIRAVGRFKSPEDVKRIVIGVGAGGPVRVGDVADVSEGYKEAESFVRTKGRRAIAFNFQREPGTNVLEIMDRLKETIEGFNEKGGLLQTKTEELKLQSPLEMSLAYDATRYVRKALVNVEYNLYIGGALAVIVLLMFLRSLRSLGIVALSIPVSMIGAIVLMVILGRTVNVVSLAGVAFAVGMVVDNSIVVLENIYRHLEMGKNRVQAARDGTSEVAGAVLASSLTTLIVFVPILLITDQAGQLFRDIAIAIITAVIFSYIVAVTVIPSTAAHILNEKRYRKDEQGNGDGHNIDDGWYQKILVTVFRSTPLRLYIVLALATISIVGAILLMPPLDYLPKGNRNVTFGLMLTPPGLNLEQLETMGKRVENVVRPYWESETERPTVPDGMGGQVTPTAISNYFLVSRGGIMFHGCISMDDQKAIDNVALLKHASRSEILPGTYAFAFQFPLFRLGGSTGSAVKIHLTGDDLDQVSNSAGALFGALMGQYGPGATRPDPGNFNLKVQEIQIRMKDEPLAEVGLTRNDVILAVQAAGDGAFLGEYQMGGDLVDMRLWSSNRREAGSITDMSSVPLVSRDGKVIPLSEVAEVVWTDAAQSIKRVGRQRAVTLEFTAPDGMPLEQAVTQLEQTIAGMRQGGVIPPSVETQLEGAAGKLSVIRKTLLGDDFSSFLASSMFLSFTAVYLLMCILFQSWVQPFIIMFSVPLATFGGFLGLSLVHQWSLSSRYMPEQNLDVLTLLGFIILAGIVVNNAILIVAQARQWLDGDGPEKDDPALAIARATESRIRPIFMSMLTSVGGMLPLVLNPGAGSELYRGLGAVVVGGMLLSTIFTLILIPVLMSLVEDLRRRPKGLLGLSTSAGMVFLMFFITGCRGVQPATKIDLSPYPEQDLPSDYSAPVKDLSVTAGEDASAKSGEDALEADERGSSTVWWRGFQDPLLEELVLNALSDHLDAQSWEKRLEGARALLERSQKESLPSVFAGAAVRRERNSALTAGTGTRWNTELGASWELDWTQRIANGAKSRLARLEQTKQQRETWRIELVSAIVEHYLSTVQTSWVLKLKTREVEALAAQEQRLKALFESGRQDQRAWIQAQSAVRQAQLEQLDIHNAMAQSRLWLEQWSGLKPNALADAFIEPKSLANPALFERGVPADLLRFRPDVLEAEARIVGAAAELDITRAEVLPRLSLQGTVSWNASQASDLFKTASHGFGVGPAISWRLFEFGRIDQEKRAARADFESAVLQWRQKVRDAVHEVERYLQQREMAIDRLKSTREVASLANDRYRLSKALQEGGRESMAVVLDSQVDLNRRRAQVLEQELRLWLIELQLYASLGG